MKGRFNQPSTISNQQFFSFSIQHSALSISSVSYFSHLECSVPCGEGPYDPRREQHLCRCGAPLLARYDLDAARAWKRESIAGRESNMWRYRELMPLFDDETPLTL